MGYNTDYSRKIRINPPLDEDIISDMEIFADQDHRDERYAKVFGGVWCNFVATKDGTAIKWNGNEKTYNGPEWIQVLIEKFVKPAGSVANGKLLAQGEEPGDVWWLIVKDNVVSVENIDLGEEDDEDD